MLSHFPTETVQLRKIDGTSRPIVGHLQPKLFTTEDVAHPIDEGDIIERTLPNGRVEQFEVLDADYYASGMMPAHYQCKLRKTTSRARQPIGPQIGKVTFTGDNARLNVGGTVVDKSSNVISAAKTPGDGVDADQWRKDVVEVLHMVVNAQDQLEEDYRAVTSAVWKLTQVNAEQMASVAELRDSAKALLSEEDMSALTRLQQLPSAIATNIVSSALYQLIVPLFS